IQDCVSGVDASNRKQSETAEGLMSRRWALMVAVTTCAFHPILALAQADPPPGFRELELALTIARAGYECPTVDHIEAANTGAPGGEALRPEVATGKNGRRFLIVTSGRRNAIPVVRPLPAAERE